MSFTFRLNTSFYNSSLSSRMVTLLRVLRIVILIRIFRLASQKKQLEVVTRRMVSWPSSISRQLLLFLSLGNCQKNSKQQICLQHIDLKLIIQQKQHACSVSLMGYCSSAFGCSRTSNSCLQLSKKLLDLQSQNISGCDTVVCLGHCWLVWCMDCRFLLG